MRKYIDIVILGIIMWLFAMYANKPNIIIKPATQDNTLLLEVIKTLATQEKWNTSNAPSIRVNSPDYAPLKEDADIVANDNYGMK